MNDIQLTKNFWLSEFVPEEVYKILGEKALWCIDPKLPEICQFLRDYFGTAIVINNWKSGGGYQNSGFRTRDYKGKASLSQHYQGRAVDIKVGAVSRTMGRLAPKIVFEEVKENWDKLKKLGLTAIEKVECTPTWTHLDCRWTKYGGELLIVNG